MSSVPNSAAAAAAAAAEGNSSSGPSARILDDDLKAEEEVVNVTTCDATCDDDDDDDDDDDESVVSTKQDHGSWNGDGTVVPWHGCVCGIIHGRPTPVFWIQCEGPCQAWYNVTPKCVNGLTPTLATHVVWTCHACTTVWQQQSLMFQKFLELPHEVMFRILEFVAKPTYRAAVLQQHIAPLNRAAYHFVQGDKSRGIWATILQKDYTIPSSANIMAVLETATSGKTNKNKRLKSTTTSSSCNIVTPSPKRSPLNDRQRRRTSKRRRKQTNFLSLSQDETFAATSHQHPRHAVQQEHWAMLNRTEDAYYIIEEAADPSNADKRTTCKSPLGERILTFQRLKQLVQQYQPMDINRSSPCTGRTLLQVVIAGEMTEGTMVSCVHYLVHYHHANPNIYSTHETPYGNRPALFFAISRVMPKVIQLLLDAGANVSATVTGTFRRTFDTTQTITGTFTPLEFAQTMKRVEVTQVDTPIASQYWISKLNACLRILEEASKKQIQGRKA